MIAAVAGVALLATASAPATAAVDTAIAACESWILRPATWADAFDTFPKAAGLEARGLRKEPGVPDIALPPATLRRAMHFWRVQIGHGGIFVVTSDQMPICHVTGGGPFDLQPAVQAVLASPSFLKKWSQVSSDERDGIVSTRFVSRESAKLSMIVSRSVKAGDRIDRPQLVATAQFEIQD